MVVLNEFARATGTPGGTGRVAVVVCPRDAIEEQVVCLFLIVLRDLSLILLEARNSSDAGVPVIPLNHSLLVAAKQAGRDVWTEISSGRYALIAVSPELLLEIPFDNLFRSRSFFQRVLFLDVDDFHGIESEGEASRPMYRQIRKLAYRNEGKLWAIA